MTAYRIEMNADDNGTLLVTCPDLPEVTTFGVDVEDARRRAQEAIEEAIAARIDAGVPLPQPKRHGGQHPVTLPLLTELKAELYTTMRDDDVTRADLARKLGWHREQVDRLFRLDHASRLDQIEAAFKALGRGLEVRSLRRA
jgi:antitoxin HicB